MSNNKKLKRTFDADKALNQMLDISSKIRPNTLKANLEYKVEVLDFLTEVNNSGYEAGYTHAIEQHEDINYLMGRPDVENNLVYTGEDILNCKNGVYRVICKNGQVLTAIIGTLKNGGRWFAGTEYSQGYALDKASCKSIELIMLITE